MINKLDEIYVKIKKLMSNQIRSPAKKRTIAYGGIILFGLLYVAGILGQMFSGGKTIGTNHAATLTLNPFKAVYFALTNGFVGIIMVLILCGSGYYYYVLHHKFDDPDPIDERGIIAGDSGGFGTAKWMPKETIEALFELGTVDEVAGTIIGTKDGKVVAQKDGRHLKNKHILVTAGTGQGKTKSFLVNHAYQCIKRDESFIATDPKGDVFSLVYPALKASQDDPDGGYDIKIFNLKNPALSHGWDCLGDIKGDIKMATSFARTTIVNTTGKEGGPDFFADGDINLLKGLVLREDAERLEQTDEYRKNGIEQAMNIDEFPDGTFPKMYSKLVATNNGLKSTKAGPGEAIKCLKPSQPWYTALSLFSQGSETIQQSNISGLGLRLGLLQNPDVARMLSRPDISLVEPAKRKCAYFIVMDDKDDSLNYVASLFFSCFFSKIIDFADAQPNQKCPVPVNLLIDEAANIGQIPAFEKLLATIRSRDISAVLVYQQITQIQDSYPGKTWNTIMGNCATHVLLGSSDTETNNYYSERCGDMTIRTKRQGVEKQTIDVFETHPAYTEGYAENKRRLLNPDEVEGLGEKNKILVKLVNQAPFTADKFFYKEHPLGKDIDEAHLFSVEQYFMEQQRQTLTKKELVQYTLEKNIKAANASNAFHLNIPDAIDQSHQKHAAEDDQEADLETDPVYEDSEIYKDPEHKPAERHDEPNITAEPVTAQKVIKPVKRGLLEQANEAVPYQSESEMDDGNPFSDLPVSHNIM